MEFRLIAATLAFVLPLLQDVQGQACTRALDLVIVIDQSGSICRDDYIELSTGQVTCANWDIIKDMAAKAVEEFDVGDNAETNTYVSLVVFSDTARAHIRFTDGTDKDFVVDYIRRLSYGQTVEDLFKENSNTAAALRVTREVALAPGNGERDGVSNVVVMITNSKADVDADLVDEEAAKLQEIARVFVVAATDSIDIDEIETIASQPAVQNQNWFYAAAIDLLFDVLDQLLTNVCCDSAASCRLDICLILDRSGSICDTSPGGWVDDPRNENKKTCSNWELTKIFVKNFTDIFTIGPLDTQIGLVVFDSQASTGMIFGLNKYTDRDQLAEQFINLPFGGGRTFTSGGLRAAREECFQEASGDRPGIQNIAIVITDGKSTVLVNETIVNADRLKTESNAAVYTIGITNSINETELKLMSSKPQALNLNYFKTEDFAGLTTKVLPTLKAVSCCVPISVERECKIDLLFMLDGSGSICDKDKATEVTLEDGSRSCSNWELEKSFAATAVRQMGDIGQANTRVAAMTFSRGQTIGFNFNTYNNREDTWKAIMAMSREGSNTNTPQAFAKVGSDMLIEAMGYRPDVQTVIVIVTDGIPCPNGASCPPPVASFIDEAVSEANRLKRNNKAYILPVGVTYDIDRGTLQRFSSPPQIENEQWWNAPDFNDLNMIISDIVDNACADPPVVTTVSTSTTTTTTTTVPPSDCRTQRDVVIVLDASGSIGEAKFQKAKEFVSCLVEVLDTDSGAIRIGVLLFSTSTTRVFHLNDFTNGEEMSEKIKDIVYTRGSTNTAAALDYAEDTMFTSSNGDRDDVPNLIMVITDGGSDSRVDTIKQAVKAKGKGIQILALGLGTWLDIYELKAIASYPYESNMFLIESYDSLIGQCVVFKDLICNNNDDCAENKCENGGTCVDDIGGYRCDCVFPYGGRHCDFFCKNPPDVAFALDASGSIGRKNFNEMIKFTSDLVDDLPTQGDQGPSVGLELFSDDKEVVFDLKAYAGKTQVIQDVISTMAYTFGGTTATHKALSGMNDILATGTQSSKVGLLLTDGRSNEPEETWKEAMKLRDNGYTILTIGLGALADTEMSELRGISSFNEDNNVYKSTDFSDLSKIKDDIRDAICNNKDECDPNPCENSGQCMDMINGYYCVCPDDYTGKHCQTKSKGKADVLFAIDMSGSIRSERFKEVLEFIVSIVKELEVWNDKVRIAALTFADSSNIAFYLNTYKTRQDIIQAIRLIKYTGGKTNIASAMAMARDIFVANKGDRQDADNYLIVFTDGKANINKENTLPEAISDRIQGLKILSVGVGQDLDMWELTGIASKPSKTNVMTVDSFSALNTLVSVVYNGLMNDKDDCASNQCQNGATCHDYTDLYECQCRDDYTGDYCDRQCRKQLDVVFVLDLSGSLDSVIKLSVAFMGQIVAGLDFGSSRARVAVVTYATDASLNFDFLKYTEKKDVQNALVFQSAGGRTNTQAALQIVTNGIRGDRSTVTNWVIVLTDGGSNIVPANTVPRAQMLQDTGHKIAVVAIGERVDMNEVNSMASETIEPYVTRLLEMDEVRNKSSSLLDEMCQ